jgi:hypothetical protein
MFKIITRNDCNFDSVIDSVETEKNIFKELLKNNDILPDNFGYVGIPLAFSINTKGLQYTQQIIDDIERKYPNFKKVFVCQHIWVSKLNFYNNVVFTPHSLLEDNYKCIPHFNGIITENDYISDIVNKYIFSFYGAFGTHPIRNQLYQFNSVNTPIIDTGEWHYYKSSSEREKQENVYKSMICNTIFNICPQGTGVSTIRLYESMAAGTIPVVLNNVKVPEEIRKFCIYTSIDKLKEDIQNYPHDIMNASKEIHKFYWKHLANDAVIRYIISNV